MRTAGRTALKIRQSSKATKFSQEQAKTIEAKALESSKFKAKYPETAVVRQEIYSPEYRRHYNELGENSNVTAEMCKQARDMLGHRTVSSTKVYAKILKNKYQSVYENCHPRAKR